MTDDDSKSTDRVGPVCPARKAADLSGVEVIELSPELPLPDCRAAMTLASRLADEHLGDHMLLSWYDRDRDFESPQHSSECHAAGAVPGYVDYGIHHGAALAVDIEAGRFLFFFMPLDL